MRTLNFNEIINLSKDEILGIKRNEILEIEEFLKTGEASNSLIETLEKDLFYINNEFNILINAWEINLKEISLEDVQKLINLSKEIKMPLKIFVQGGDYVKQDIREKVDFLFNDDSMEKLNEINKYLTLNKEKELVFIDSDITSENQWSISEIYHARERIDKIRNLILECNLSPLEAIAFIHKIVTKSFQYHENEEEAGKARTIVGVLNSNNIVCVGYANIIKSIVDRLDNPNLICDGLTIQVQYDENLSDEVTQFEINGEGHMKNVIFINDEKYNVSGVYLLDATYDSRSDRFPKGKGFANFMLPVTDLVEYKGQTVKQYEDVFEEFFGMYGLENSCPEIPPIITKYQDQSDPIPYEILEKVIKKVIRIIFFVKDEKILLEKLEQEMNLSMIYSKALFSNNATNSIKLEAEKYDFVF